MPELKDLTIIISSKADEIGINKTLNSILEVSPGELCLLLVLSDYQSEQVSRLSNQIQAWDADIKLVPAEGIYRAQNTGLREAKTSVHHVVTALRLHRVLCAGLGHRLGLRA